VETHRSPSPAAMRARSQRASPARCRSIRLARSSRLTMHE
jgi:hypothetical protein